MLLHYLEIHRNILTHMGQWFSLFSHQTTVSDQPSPSCLFASIQTFRKKSNFYQKYHIHVVSNSELSLALASRKKHKAAISGKMNMTFV